MKDKLPGVIQKTPLGRRQLKKKFCIYLLLSTSVTDGNVTKSHLEVFFYRISNTKMRVL